MFSIPTSGAVTRIFARHTSRTAARAVGSMSFASPESDFSRPTHHEIAISVAGSSYSRKFNTTSLSFSTPNADFCAPSRDIVLKAPSNGTVRNHSSISFATPFADVVAPAHYEMFSSSSGNTPKHTTTISYSTPFSDFASPSADHIMSAPVRPAATATTTTEVITNLSFSSPYSDFVAPTAADLSAPTQEQYDASHFSFSSPYADAVAPSAAHVLSAPELSEEDSHPHISFATALSDFTAPHANEVLAANAPLPEHNVEHISFASPFADVVSQPHYTAPESPPLEAVDVEAAFFAELPREVAAAVASSKRSLQARVITESKPPFRITFVNDAWVGLCGFSSEEAVGKSLSMLQGARTDNEQLQRLHEDTMRRQVDRMSFNLINYRKDGSEFANHLRIVPLHNKAVNEEVTHFLGVLEDVATTARAREERLMLQLDLMR